MVPDDLTEAEAALWDAFACGRYLDLRVGNPQADDPARGAGWGGDRTVRGEVISQLMLGAQPGKSGFVPRVHLSGARITGRLVLSFADSPHALVLERCLFEERPDLYWAALGFTSFQGSVLPGLLASNLSVRGHLRLIDCSFTGEVRLRGAKIAGGMLLASASLSNPGEVALNLHQAEIAADLSMVGGLKCEGGIRLADASIGGSLTLDRARISAPGRVVLAADNVKVGESIHAQEAHLAGEVCLQQAVIGGGLYLSGAKIASTGGKALRGPRLEAAKGVFLGRGFTADGEVDLTHARVGRHIFLDHAVLRNDGASTFRAEGCVIDGDLDARGLKSEGTVVLADARVGGAARFEAAVLSAPGSRALAANGIQVGTVLNLCEGFTAKGRIGLTSARAGSRLCLDGGSVDAPGAVALKCWRANAPELVLRTAGPIQGTVSLQYASFGIIRDDPGTWPGELLLDGLSYDILDPPLPAERRLAWLARDPGGHLSQPYEQLAANYRSLGSDADARAVLLARQRTRRSALSWYAQAWGYLQDITVGYGYRPTRAALWLAALLSVGTIVFGIDPPKPYTDTPVPPFNPLIYTLNLLLPVINFGQAQAYDPQGLEQWLAYIFTAAGWTLATAVAAGIIRVLQRN